MTRRFFTVVGMLVLWASTASVSHAVLTLELSSPDDLLNLTVGDTATIEVSLAGLDTAAGEELVSLTGSVLFPGAILGTPTSMTAGSIIPNPLSDPLDFQTFAAPGQADGTFITFSVNSSEHITTNGTFFTFDVTAGHAGSGVFTIDPLAISAEQYDPTGFLPILRTDLTAGPDLPFVVRQPVTGAIPEPLTFGLGAMTLAAIGLTIRRRRA